MKCLLRVEIPTIPIFLMEKGDIEVSNAFFHLIPSEGNHNILNKLHKRAAYMVSKKSWDTPSLDVFHYLSWPTLDNLFLKTTCCLLNKTTPQIVYERFILATQTEWCCGYQNERPNFIGTHFFLFWQRSLEWASDWDKAITEPIRF